MYTEKHFKSKYMTIIKYITGNSEIKIKSNNQDLRELYTHTTAQYVTSKNHAFGKQTMIMGNANNK